MHIVHADEPEAGTHQQPELPFAGQGGPATGETDFDNWQPIAGLNLPLTRHNKQNGQDSSTAEYKSLELNPSVDSKLFEKPEEKTSAQPSSH